MATAGIGHRINQMFRQSMAMDEEAQRNKDNERAAEIRKKAAVPEEEAKTRSSGFGANEQGNMKPFKILPEGTQTIPGHPLAWDQIPEQTRQHPTDLPAGESFKRIGLQKEPDRRIGLQKPKESGQPEWVQQHNAQTERIAALRNAPPTHIQEMYARMGSAPSSVDQASEMAPAVMALMNKMQKDYAETQGKNQDRDWEKGFKERELSLQEQKANLEAMDRRDLAQAEMQNRLTLGREGNQTQKEVAQIQAGKQNDSLKAVKQAKAMEAHEKVLAAGGSKQEAMDAADEAMRVLDDLEKDRATLKKDGMPGQPKASRLDPVLAEHLESIRKGSVDLPSIASKIGVLGADKWTPEHSKILAEELAKHYGGMDPLSSRVQKDLYSATAALPGRKYVDEAGNTLAEAVSGWNPYGGTLNMPGIGSQDVSFGMFSDFGPDGILGQGTYSSPGTKIKAGNQAKFLYALGKQIEAMKAQQKAPQK